MTDTEELQKAIEGIAAILRQNELHDESCRRQPGNHSVFACNPACTCILSFISKPVV
jgi:hypothetical protein